MNLRSYLNRPAKSIERLMLVDGFRRLASFGPLSQYAYVGMGAHEFVDFELVWRTLGITNMTSIERNAPIDRYQFNKPFGSITVKHGEASAVVPTLTFAPHTIVWLDYTGKLTQSVINDVTDVVRRIGSGSLLVVTVNAHPETELSKRRDRVVKDLGASRVPSTVTDASLAKWGLAALGRDVLSDEVAQAMRARLDAARFEQLFHFRYSDTSKMLTWGGVAVAESDRPAFDDARFDELEFVRRGPDPCELLPPALTLREMLRLNDELPLPAGASGPLAWLDPEEIKAYAWLHRWYPSVP